MNSQALLRSEPEVPGMSTYDDEPVLAFARPYFTAVHKINHELGHAETPADVQRTFDEMPREMAIRPSATIAGVAAKLRAALVAIDAQEPFFEETFDDLEEWQYLVYSAVADLDRMCRVAGLDVFAEGKQALEIGEEIEKIAPGRQDLLMEIRMMLRLGRSYSDVEAHILGRANPNGKVG